MTRRLSHTPGDTRATYIVHDKARVSTRAAAAMLVASNGGHTCALHYFTQSALRPPHVTLSPTALARLLAVTHIHTRIHTHTLTHSPASPPGAGAMASQVHKQRPPRPTRRRRRRRRALHQPLGPAAPVAAAAQQPVQYEQRAIGRSRLQG